MIKITDFLHSILFYDKITKNIYLLVIFLCEQKEK